MWNTDSRLLNVPADLLLIYCSVMAFGGGGPGEKISIVKIKPELSFSVVTELLNRIPGPVRRNEFQNKKIHECIIRAFAGITDAPLSTVEKLTVAHSFNKPDDFI